MCTCYTSDNLFCLEFPYMYNCMLDESWSVAEWMFRKYQNQPLHTFARILRDLQGIPPGSNKIELDPMVNDYMINQLKLCSDEHKQQRLLCMQLAPRLSKFVGLTI